MSTLNAPNSVSFGPGDSVPQHFKAFTNYLNQQATLYADKPFVHYISNGTFKTLTYADVDRMAINLACKWANKVQSLDVVSFLCDHSVNYMIVLIAILKLRTTMLAISPRNSQAAAVNLLEKTGSKLLIADIKYEAMAKAATSQVPGVNLFTVSSFDFDLLAREPHNLDHRQILNLNFSDHDILKPALIFHSSGSTAFPKPISLSNRHLFYAIDCYVNQVNANNKLENLTTKDTSLALVPIFHTFGITLHFGLTTFGGSCVFLEKLPASQTEIFHALVATNATLFAAPPLIYEQMLCHLKESNDLDIAKRLKYAVYGGAQLKESILDWFHANNVNVRCIYGCTEASTIMTTDMDRNNKNRSLQLYQKDAQGVPYGVFEVNDASEPHVKHLYLCAGSPYLALNVANRADGGYDTQDLFIENPEYPGSYKYIGRRDDTLVMENGEKTNPVPMETIIRQSSMVQQVAVIGHGRQCSAALIQLNKDVAQQSSQKEIYTAVHTAVKQANLECPNHSKIFPEMVMILSLDQALLTTDKGTVMRKKAEAMYQDKVDQMYKDFLEGPRYLTSAAHADDNDTSTWTCQQTEEFLIECAAEVLDIPASVIRDSPRSLFEYGLNSISAIQLRNLIAEYFENVSSNFLFQHYSIESMRKALMNGRDQDASEQAERRYQQTKKLTEYYIKRAKVDFPRATNHYGKKKAKVILLTGATGSLGSFILRELLLDPTVEKVYCCVRGQDHELKDRLVEAITYRSLDASVLDTDRVGILPMRFNEPFLGLSSEQYKQLKKEVTIIQHCAWMLDFNMPLDHYDKECIQPFYNLLKFAYKEVNPMHIHFVSSVSASGASGKEIAEEPLPLDPHVSFDFGYAFSKFVVEILLNYLTTEKNFPCYIQRLGQVCGDSVHGVWNSSEQYPLMFIGGGSIMHKMPQLDIVIDWITVDSAAATIADIMIRTAYLPANIDQSIYHIVNPHLLQWSDILLAMKKSGMKFKTVDPTQWIQDLAQDDSNPAFRLMPFYQGNFNDSFKMPVWRTEKTSAFTPVILKCPVLDAELFTKFLNHWQRIGFYKPIN